MSKFEDNHRPECVTYQKQAQKDPFITLILNINHKTVIQKHFYMDRDGQQPNWQKIERGSLQKKIERGLLLVPRVTLGGLGNSMQ